MAIILWNFRAINHDYKTKASPHLTAPWTLGDAHRGGMKFKQFYERIRYK